MFGESYTPLRRPNSFMHGNHTRSLSPLTRKISTTTGCPNHVFYTIDGDAVPKVTFCAAVARSLTTKGGELFLVEFLLTASPLLSSALPLYLVLSRQDMVATQRPSVCRIYLYTEGLVSCRTTVTPVAFVSYGQEQRVQTRGAPSY